MLKNGNYPLGFWNYTDIDNPRANMVKDWVDAGMTMALTPRYVKGEGNKEKMLAVLDEAARCGIGCILCDERIDWLLAVDREDYRARLASVLEDFGHHPAVIGLHVGDEPGVNGEDEVDRSCFVYRLMKKMAPHLNPFLNLHPWHMTGLSTPGFMNRPGVRYVDVLDEYVKIAGLDYLCYDCYSQMNPGDSGFNMYFRNLEMHREAAQRNHIPFWTTLLCSAHFKYRVPTENEYRWQLYTAAAHGAQGVLWFHFYLLSPHGGYHAAPIDEHWERTESFQWMSRVQRTFNPVYGRLLMKLKLDKVYHINRSYGGVPLFEEGCDDLVVCAHIPPEHGAILSRFVHEDGSVYYALTNNSQTETLDAGLRFRAGVRLYEVRWDGISDRPLDVKEEEYRGYLNCWKGVKSIRVGDWMTPGQMLLWKVEKA